jgi:3-phosphoshikimate 1-carboxyvinyltransferase
MTLLRVTPATSLRGTTTVPGDKSISHRALLLGSLARGENYVRGWLPAGDTLATLGAIRALGIDVQRDGDRLTFTGDTWKQPSAPIDCENAGTLMRLIAGMLAGQPFPSVLDGSNQLRKRPMRRITEPLRAMGADIDDTDGKAPITIRPAALRGMTHELKIASAQIKSAILLAGLFADAPTTVIEPGPGRDHTERMLASMGATIKVDGAASTVAPLNGTWLTPLDLTIPGDPSSAAFLIVAASIAPSADLTITGVGLNATRTGLIDVLHRMGADIVIKDENEQGGEPVGTIRLRSANLMGTSVGGAEVVRAIDEIPILAVAATQADGETVITDAAEMRVKEVDRIAVLAGELRKMGAQIEERPDGMLISGPTRLHGALVHSHGDHRMAMALAVAGLVADGETCIEDAGCINDSFPGFKETLVKSGANLV